MLDTGAHFYDVYECSDGEYISIGSIEPQFYAELVEKLGLDAEDFANQHDRSRWPELKEKVAAVVATRTRDEWDAVLEGSDVCYAPVLTVSEAIESSPQRGPGNLRGVGWASCSPVRPPASAAPLVRSAARRPTRASTPTNSWSSLAWAPTRWPPCGPRAPSPERKGF